MNTWTDSERSINGPPFVSSDVSGRPRWALGRWTHSARFLYVLRQFCRLSTMRKAGFLQSVRGRFFSVGLSLVVLLILVGVGMLLATTSGASVVAQNARELHWTNATLGASGIARAAVAQAVFFSFPDVSDEEARRDAVAEARRNIANVSSVLLVDDVPSDPALIAALEQFVDMSTAVVDVAEQGDPAQAEIMRSSDLEFHYAELAGKLEGRQDDLAEVILNSDQVAGRISRIATVAIAFLVPGVAILLFWFSFRQRMRAREEDLGARIEAARSLNLAKDELIAGISHELRTPLTSIHGFSEILLEYPGIDSGAQELIGFINASSADLTRMVNDLLTAAKLDANGLVTSFEEVDLAREVNAVVAPYRRGGHVIETDLSPSKLFTDSLRVRQIIHNLVSNALRHGGDRIRVSTGEKEGSVVLVVADNGAGVKPGMEDLLFKRFANPGRRALVAGSVGLGLAISRELASKLGGELDYTREDGWTLFSLHLRSWDQGTVSEVSAELAPVEVGG